MKTNNKLILILFTYIFAACSSIPDGNISRLNNKPIIEPDYSEITIPFNIAPLNFSIEEKGDAFFVRILDEKGETIEVSDKMGIIKIPEKKWKKLLKNNVNQKLTYQVFVKREGVWKQFEPFSNTISESPVAPYLYYRLLFPGYESWTEISIMQRSLESFEEKVVVENNVEIGRASCRERV